MRSARLELADMIAETFDLKAFRGRLDRSLQVKYGSITRVDTTATPLFALPADADVVLVTIYGPAGSNVVGTAEVVVGREDGSDQYFVRPISVLGLAGRGQLVPQDVRLGAPGEPVVVTGQYSETGVPSTSGGPWFVAFFYTRD